MSAAENGVERTLGLILGRLDGVDSHLQAIDTRLDRAEAKRGETYVQLNELSNRVGKLEGDVKDINSTVHRVEAFERRSEGAAWLGGKIGRAIKWAIGGGFVALITFWRELVALIRG